MGARGGAVAKGIRGGKCGKRDKGREMWQRG